MKTENVIKDMNPINFSLSFCAKDLMKQKHVLCLIRNLFLSFENSRSFTRKNT